jgi:hypothetical protein
MSTIELVDPELRDALALWPLLPLTAESLTRRRANALELIGAVPKPNLPDIATHEIAWAGPGCRSSFTCIRGRITASIGQRMPA